MRLTSLAVLMLSAAASLAGDDPARALRGKWRLDKNGTIEAMPGYDRGTPEQQKEIKQRFSAAVPDATVEFSEKDFVFDTADGPAETFPYRVTGAKDKRVDLEIVTKDSEGKQVVEKAYVVGVAPDVLHFTKEDVGFAMVLRRLK
jgi:hypothetical protein